MNNIEISNHWNNKELLAIDCLIKADGIAIILNTYKVDSNLFCFPLCETTVQSLEKYNKDLWSNVDIFTKEVAIGTDRKLVGGEGGMGNEGFIVCTNQTNNLIWALYFTNSNPFYKIEFNETYIYAYSSADLIYQIEIERPELIKITHFK